MMVDDLNRRWLQYGESINVRQHQWKTTSMEDDHFYITKYPQLELSLALLAPACLYNYITHISPILSIRCIQWICKLNKQL